MKTNREEKEWAEINWQFMSEESSGDDGKINKHPLPWRSVGGFDTIIVWVKVYVRGNC